MRERVLLFGFTVHFFYFMEQLVVVLGVNAELDAVINDLLLQTIVDSNSISCVGDRLIKLLV